MTDEQIKTPEIAMKRIPYGLTDFTRIRNENYYYVDKTAYLALLPKLGDFQFFIRPRRFGKTLFIAMMECYFDIYFKDRFEELFKGTWIYDHPTKEKNQYLVLSFNFTTLDEDIDKLEDSFIAHVRSRSMDFIAKYHTYLSSNSNFDFYTKQLKTSNSATGIFSTLIGLCKNTDLKLYIIIDEYDNFINAVRSEKGEKAYHDLAQRTSYFLSFFKALKVGTSGTFAPIHRIFISGVSSITMDDGLSGFNIALNITTESELNSMVGFTKQEVAEMIDYYRSFGKVKHSTPYLLDIMNQWYGNYQFSNKGEFKVFNSDMVLFFMSQYLRDQEIPENLIDSNVRIDYEKLRHLIIIDKKTEKTTNGNFSKLKEICEKGSTTGTIVDGFPVEKLLDPDNFQSLLFYFGLLTINGEDQGLLRLEIPNETARRLYFNYISEAYRETGVFNIDISRYNNLMSAMGFKGEWEPLFEYIFSLMKKSMSLRDLITGEKSIQAFLNVYLGLSSFYIIHVERELNKGYADLLMEPFIAQHPALGYSYLLEIKYLGAGHTKDEPEVEQLITAAETQLRQYALDEKFHKNVEKTKLIKLVVIFSGHEAIYYQALSS